MPLLTPSYHPIVSLICSVTCARDRDLQRICRMLDCRDIYNAKGEQDLRAFQVTEEHLSLKAVLRSVI